MSIKRIFCEPNNSYLNYPLIDEKSSLQPMPTLNCREMNESDSITQMDLTSFYCYYIVSQGAWVLKPRNSQPRSVVHFIGGIFVGAAPQLTYRLFLERLSEK